MRTRHKRAPKPTRKEMEQSHKRRFIRTIRKIKLAPRERTMVELMEDAIDARKKLK